MGDTLFIILVIILAIVIIGCIIRYINHTAAESCFDVASEYLVSTEKAGGNYCILFDASGFPSNSDDPSNTYHSYRLRIVINKTGWVTLGDIVATVKVLKNSTTVSPSGSHNREYVFREYFIKSPLDGFVYQNMESLQPQMCKFVVFYLRPGAKEMADAEGEKIKENDFLL